MATQITAAQCTPLATAPGHALRADAAHAWDRAVHDFGATVLLTDSWRSYATQEKIFRDRYTKGYLVGRPGYTTDARWWQGSWWTRRTGTAAAAVPGTSNHGSGLSVDVRTSRRAGDPPHPLAVVFTGFQDADRRRFLQVAKSHGWADDEGRDPTVLEPWHLTYYPGRDKHPSSITTPPQEDDIMASLDDLRNVIRQEVGRPAVLYRVAGTTAGWWDLGTARTHPGYPQYLSWDPRPGLVDLPLYDRLWRKPVLGVPGEVFALTETGAQWAVDVLTAPREGHVAGALVRTWVPRSVWQDLGGPEVTVLPAIHDIWTLPIIGDRPKGA